MDTRQYVEEIEEGETFSMERLGLSLKQAHVVSWPASDFYSLHMSVNTAKDPDFGVWIAHGEPHVPRRGDDGRLYKPNIVVVR